MVNWIKCTVNSRFKRLFIGFFLIKVGGMSCKPLLSTLLPKLAIVHKALIPSCRRCTCCCADGTYKVWSATIQAESYAQPHMKQKIKLSVLLTPKANWCCSHIHPPYTAYENMFATLQIFNNNALGMKVAEKLEEKECNWRVRWFSAVAKR